MKARLVAELPVGPEWLYEVAFRTRGYVSEIQVLESAETLPHLI